MVKVALDSVNADFAVMVRDGCDSETVDRYAEILEQMPPVTIFLVNGEHLLADGFHRYSAALRKGWTHIEADLREGTRAQALEHAIVANLSHGRPFTASEYKKATQRLAWLYGLQTQTPEQGISFEPRGIISRIAGTLHRGENFVDRILRAGTVRQHVPSSPLLSDSHMEAISRAPQSAWHPLAESAALHSWKVEDVQDRVRQIRAGQSPAQVIVRPSPVQIPATFGSNGSQQPTLREESRQAFRQDPGLRREFLEELKGEPAQPIVLAPEIGQDKAQSDVVSGLVQQFEQKLRQTLAQVPDRSDRIADIVQEEMAGLQRRLELYPKNTLRMQAKFEQLRVMEERGVIPYTVWDFPYRDDYAGDKTYHGNCSPQTVEQCVWRMTDEGDLVVDPMVGSGTTIDVCKQYNRRCCGYDLTPARDDIIRGDAKHLPLDAASVDMVFLHPPYWKLVRYSNGADNEADLSASATFEDFNRMLTDVFIECQRILKPGKVLCVLLGDMVRDAGFLPICRKAANILEALGMTDCGYAVKLAHGDLSRKKSGVILAELAATNNLKISHDLVLFFRKE